MVWKFVVTLALIVIANAIELHHAPLHGYAAPALSKAVEIEDGPAEYEFSYSVHDPHTGDIKGQKESRKGDVVVGSYELIDSDGHRRLVQYHADKHNGFNAIVHREPTDIKIPIPEHKIIAPVHKVIAAPVVHYAPAHITKVVAPATQLFATHGHATHGHATHGHATHGHATHGHETHVSFAAPSFSYHY